MRKGKILIRLGLGVRSELSIHTVPVAMQLRLPGFMWYSVSEHAQGIQLGLARSPKVEDA